MGGNVRRMLGSSSTNSRRLRPLFSAIVLLSGKWQ
jgi:hypothetical protein